MEYGTVSMVEECMRAGYSFSTPELWHVHLGVECSDLLLEGNLIAIDKEKKNISYSEKGKELIKSILTLFY